MFCNKCGTEINNTAKFCPKCGNEIKTNNQTYNQPNYQTYNQNINTNNISSKNQKKGLNILVICGLVLSCTGILIPLLGAIGIGFACVGTYLSKQNNESTINIKLGILSIVIGVVFIFFYMVSHSV